MEGGTITNGEIRVYGTFQHAGGTVGDSATVALFNDNTSFWDMTGGTNTVAKFTTSVIRDMEYVCARLRGGYFNPVQVVHEGRCISVESGCELGPATNWQVPQDSSDSSALTFNGITNCFSSANRLYIGTGGNYTRHSTTGHLAIVDSQITFTNALDFVNTTRMNAESRLSITNSRVWHNRNFELFTSQNDTGSTAGIDVGPGSEFVVAGVAAASGHDDIWETTDSELYASTSINLSIGDGAYMHIDGGTVRVADRLSPCGGGTIVLDSGDLRMKRLFTYPGSLVRPARVEVNGGRFICEQSRMYLGRDANKSDAYNMNMPSIDFVQTGGVVSNAYAEIELGGVSTNGTVRYEISGGELGVNTYFIILTNGVAEVAKKGSSAKTMITGFDVGETTGAQNDFLLEYIFDSSMEHIIPWTFIDGNKGVRCGNLRLRLDGGAMMSSNTTFNLMVLDPYWTGTEEFKFYGTFLKFNNSSEKTQNFRTLPDASLWSVGLSDDAYTVYATLADPLATFSGTSGTLDLSSSPQPMGSVEVGGLSSSLRSWTAQLKVAAADGTALSETELESLADDLCEAGYTNSYASASSEYNLVVEMTPDMLPTGTGRFVWDFTRTESARTADSVTTNAVVLAISTEGLAISPGTFILFR